MSEYEKIIAASGYFDPLHVGHVEYLQKAKAIGGKLVVIVNNERQAKLKKGYEFMPFEERIAIVKALGCVDDVFASIDEDGSVSQSLAALKPDIFAKGGDRHAGEIPEKSICDELGIAIVDGLGAKIQASSELVKKAQAHT
ncbi:MAG: adenylyltransferase/cytidyltransferase family protein [Nanoarchaeota archaeon]